MIQVTQNRNGKLVARRKMSLNSALQILVLAELCYGGEVTEVSMTRIVVETLALDTLDQTIFEGTESEMQLLVELCAYYSKLTLMKITSSIEVCDLAPPFLAILFNLEGGRKCIKIALMLTAKVVDEEAMLAGMNLKVDDLLVACELARQGDCSFSEAVALAA